jgi:hypothetical protein
MIGLNLVNVVMKDATNDQLFQLVKFLSLAAQFSLSFHTGLCPIPLLRCPFGDTIDLGRR